MVPRRNKNNRDIIETVDGSEIPETTWGMYKTPINNDGRLYKLTGDHHF